MKKATHWKKLTNPNYLGSWDIEPGGELIVEILKVQKELVTAIGGETEECVVAQIKDHKPLILNKTNCKTIQQIIGSPYIEDWKNKQVALVVEKVRAFGAVHDAIRVKGEKVDQREVLDPMSPRWEGAIEHLKTGKNGVDMNYIKKTFQITEENLEKLQEEVNAQSN